MYGLLSNLYVKRSSLVTVTSNPCQWSLRCIAQYEITGDLFLLVSSNAAFSYNILYAEACEGY